MSDSEIEMIEQRKLREMKRRMKVAQPQPKAEQTPRELVESVLYDRGDEVLDAAYSLFPVQTERLVGELAKMVKEGNLGGKVSGGELYSIFRQLGLRFRLKTSIKVQDKGRLVDLSEKLASDKEA